MHQATAHRAGDIRGVPVASLLTGLCAAMALAIGCVSNPALAQQQPAEIGPAYASAAYAIVQEESLSVLGPAGCMATLNLAGPPRQQDQVWLISSRSLREGDDRPQSLKCYRYDVERGWLPAEASGLFGPQRLRGPLVVSVHGNRTDSKMAVRVGWAGYHATLAGAGRQPVRYVLWSWPSTTRGRGLDDVRRKAVRTDLEAYLLASTLAEVSPQDRVSVVGWSFGARIATGALHLLAGGELAGRALPDAGSGEGASLRVVLLGAALDRKLLITGGEHDRAVERIDRMLLLNNSVDPVLKRYRLVSRSDRPEALGYAGLVDGALPPTVAARITQIDTAGIIGTRHDVWMYNCQPLLMRAAGRWALWRPVP